MKKLTLLAILTLAAMTAAHAEAPRMSAAGIALPDDFGYVSGVDEFGRLFIAIEGDTVHASYLPGIMPEKSKPLDNDDYVRVAEELGVEPAAIKAVVSVETGATQRGFYAEGKPVINFDLSVFKQMAMRRNINLSRYGKSHAVVFSRPNTARYGSYQKAQQARLDAAMTIDSIAAIHGTFWGMFQIGGFNWKRCGADSPADFVRRMASSEQEQLQLFAEFIRNSGLLGYLKNKDWSNFARIYNGPQYAARGYHTKLANAYARFKKEFA